MKSRSGIILVVIIFTFLSTGIIAARLGSMQVYLDGKLVPARTIVQNNEVYISVSDLAVVFPGQFKMDVTSGNLEIHSKAPENMNLPDSIPAVEGGISGIVNIKDRNGKFFPLRNVKITLLRPNPSIPDEAMTGMVKRWAQGKDNSLVESLGKVRETQTDASGRFFMTPVPPGDYEIIAIYYTTEGKTGCFWRKRIKAEKDKHLNLKFDNEDSYNFN
jgi:hypothetical protein